LAAASAAEAAFNAQFRDHRAPEDIENKVFLMEPTIIDYLVDQGFADSRSAAKILVEQGAVTVGDTKITDPTAVVPLRAEPTIIQVGKRRFGSASLAK